MSQLRWLAMLCMPLWLSAQTQTSQTPVLEKQGGNLSFGVRNTISAFNHGDPGEIGAGIGGHFRMQLVDRVNTEWFADIIPANIHNRARRMDYHIGWSVMYYLIDPKGFNRKFTPYVVAGHCFDLTQIRLNGKDAPPPKRRLSSAVQAGLGCHYNITPKFDISLTTQYMLHLGKELHTHQEADGSVTIEEHKNAGWEGHLLVSISFNYKFMKLWKPKK